MALTDDITLLSQVPLFEDFSDEMLRLIAFGSERKKIAKNRPLFHEGSSADCAFVIMSGQFKLLQRDRRGKPIQVGEADRGDLLGELAIISAANRKVTAMAVEDSEARLAGVQFHPESILTPLGGRLIDNAIAWAARGRQE